MSNAQVVKKYWMTACDENRRVILNEMVNTGSLNEAKLIAESRVAERYHGSICITDEHNNPISEKAKHTPTPWKLERLTGGGYHNVGIRVTGPVVSGYAAFINTRWPNENQCAEQEANAALIVRACNSHDQLLTALRAGRVAIDVLMASLIEADPSFRPTQSPAWPALVAIKNALDAAEAP